MAITDTITEMRHHRRLKAFVPVILERDTIPSRAHLLDISTEGARLHTPITPGTHQEVVLVWEDERIAGKVIWTVGKRFGVAFDAPICPELVEQILR